MVLSAVDIARMIDISAVRTDSSDEKVAEAVTCARQYNCYLVTILPAQTLLAKKLLGELGTPRLGGNVGFPSGGQTTAIKALETQELVKMGVDEIDMVINAAALISGRTTDVYNDIAAVVEAAESRPVKVILECHYLNNDQIRSGCDQVIRAGAAFVKTGTGWAPSGASLENIELIKRHVGDAIKIKASGGVRGIETINKMYLLGATRFGISVQNVIKLFKVTQQA
jgi:deoxyribose-phosphate aldolase